jgi:hypothetical protein
MPEGTALVSFAAPSCLLPGTVMENIYFLNGRVDEVALCFFEYRTCLDYTETDVPPELAGLSLSFHVHLPFDLPWPARSGVQYTASETADIALAVCRKAATFAPGLAVLHPPQGSPALKRQLLRQFAQAWQRASDIPLLLENVFCCDLVELGDDFLRDHGLGLCLDVAHLLIYDQSRLLTSDLPETTGLVHWSAPGEQDEHLPLTKLSSAQYATATELMARFVNNPVHLAEVFHWPGVEASLSVLKRLVAAETRGIGI